MPSATTPDDELLQFLSSPAGKGTKMHVVRQLAALLRNYGYVSQASFAAMRKLLERIELEATTELQATHVMGAPANDVSLPAKDRSKRRAARKLPRPARNLPRDR